MNNADIYRIVIVEDDRHVRDYLTESIHKHAKLILHAAVGTLTEARQCMADTPRIVLVDLDLPDGSGVDLIRDYYDPESTTDFMVLTSFGDSKHVIPALEAGATGYLLKTTPVQDIAPAIIQLIHGEAPISPAIAKKMLSRFHPQASSTGENTLSDRETEILQLLSKGYNHKEAAKLLHISYHTLVTHVKHIHKKLAVKSRAEAIFEATQRGLIHRY